MVVEALRSPSFLSTKARNDVDALVDYICFTLNLDLGCVLPFAVIGSRECLPPYSMLASTYYDFYMPYRIQQQRSMLDKVRFLCRHFRIMLNFTNYKRSLCSRKKLRNEPKRSLRRSKPKLTNQLLTLALSAHY